MCHCGGMDCISVWAEGLETLCDVLRLILFHRCYLGLCSRAPFFSMFDYCILVNFSRTFSVWMKPVWLVFFSSLSILFSWFSRTSARSMLLCLNWLEIATVEHASASFWFWYWELEFWKCSECWFRSISEASLIDFWKCLFWVNWRNQVRIYTGSQVVDLLCNAFDVFLF